MSVRLTEHRTAGRGARASQAQRTHRTSPSPSPPLRPPIAHNPAGGANASEECAPLRALRPNWVRQTVLELGPSRNAGTLGGALDGNTKKATNTARERLRNESVPLNKKKGLDGHSEYVMGVMRDFFQTRPYSVLLDVFRTQDIDSSGDIDLEEFKIGLRKLNLGLSDKDMGAIFRATDADDSGSVDLDEFFNCFRTDSFPRDTFFWSKTRPRGLLSRDERVKLAQTLGDSTMHQKQTTGDIMDLIQSKVDQTNTKTVFQSFDANRSGRVSVRELVGALKQFEIMLSDTEGQDLIGNINARVGEDKRSHMTYLSFVNAFNRGEKVSAGYEGTGFDDLQEDDVPKRRAPRPPTEANPDDFRDSIQRMSAMVPTRELMETSYAAQRAARSAKPRDEPEERHDMMSGWRGLDGVSAGGAKNLGLMGRAIDWNAYSYGAKQSIYSQRRMTVGEMGAAPAPRAPAVIAAPMPLEGNDYLATLPLPNKANPRAPRQLKSPRNPADTNLTSTVAACLTPRLGTHHLNESDRLTRREALWCPPEVTSNKEKKAARSRALAERMFVRDKERMKAAEDELAQVEKLELSRFRARTAFNQRTEDWQQVIESRANESGRRPVIFEPPSKEGWCDAPPHLVSHWDTIGQHNLDPPARQHVKMITSYRKAFPTGSARPETPVHTVWGGVHQPVRGGIFVRPPAAPAAPVEAGE